MPKAGSSPASLYQVIIIGAGVSGIYQLYKALECGFDVTLLEAGGDLGGTWYWNRYPGARFDSESYTYGYSFSKEILQAWNWSEHFSGQPETLRYLNYVAEKFDLRRYMQFDSKVKTAKFIEDRVTWSLELDDGAKLECRFLITAIGMLSAPTMPNIDGVDSFEGQSFHTYYWPTETVDLANKRVGIIGTGATAVQIIPEIAGKVSKLFVFQRRPNWCAPLHNSPIDDDTQATIKRSYDKIFDKCSRTPGGFIHEPDRRKYSEVSSRERIEFWEYLYRSPGFGVWVGNFRDVLIDPVVNAEYTKFIEQKIKERVADSETADKLIPKDHGFGTRRVPLETNYYETYNRNNVYLIDINETPIKKITGRGIKTSDQEFHLDTIIYSTGFDAITGSFDRINFSGVGGWSLYDKWADGPSTYLGMQTAGFPNLIMISGPQGGSVATNFPRGIEEAVDWVTALLCHLIKNNFTRIEAKSEAERAWTEHVKDTYNYSLLPTTKSWFTGYNSNVDGRDKLRYLIYNGGAPRYRKHLESAASGGYDGFDIR